MRRIVTVCFVLLLTASVFSGCATWNKWTGRDETSKPKSDLPNQAYYGFPDIPIPKELNLDADKSFVYETQTVKVGVLVLSGNVDAQSLDEYFKINMAKNGWRFVNNFKFRGDIAANYTKSEKTAAIKISRGSFNTDVEIWIGPASSFDTRPIDRDGDRGAMPRGNGSSGKP